jgi:DNA-binding LacI/PurR family transcriptional regulator
MVTIKDVAQKANVSVGTTSRALQGVGYVSKEAKMKVLEAANELGYVVNLGAKKLKSSNSKKAIGLIVSDFGNDYFYQVISVLHQMLQELKIEFIVAFSARNPNDEVKQFKYLISNRVSTILFIPTTDKNRDVLDLATKNGVNVIQLFIKVYKDYPAIVNDDEQGCFLATKRLLELSCKRIALLDVDYSNFSCEIEPSRTAGLLHAIKEMSEVNFLVIKHNPSEKFTPEIISQIEAFNPDGIIAGTGMSGLRVLEYLKTTSRKIKFVSFDDNEWLEYKGTTAIRQDIEGLVKRICQMVQQESNTIHDSYEKVDETIVIRED